LWALQSDQGAIVMVLMGEAVCGEMGEIGFGAGSVGDDEEAAGVMGDHEVVDDAAGFVEE